MIEGLEDSEYKESLIEHSVFVTQSWEELNAQMKRLINDKLAYNQLDVCVPFEAVWSNYVELYRSYKSTIDRGLLKFVGKPALRGEQDKIMTELNSERALFKLKQQDWHACERDIRGSYETSTSVQEEV